MTDRGWRELREGGVEEVVDAGAVFGGDGENGRAERMKFRGERFLPGRVDLIHRDEKRFAGGAEKPTEFLIEGSDAGLGVDDENEQGGFSDGDMGLAENLLRDESFIVGNNAAGVDDLERVAAPIGFAVDAVAGDAGLVGDDGAARAGQAIEERGLADVRAADDHERWKFF